MRLLNRLEALLKRTRRASRSVGSKRRRDLLLSDLNEVALIRAWSIVDAYLVNRPDEIMTGEIPVPSDPDDLLGTIHSDVLRSLSNFRRQDEFWNRGLGLDLKPYRGRLDEYRAIRNSVVHGAGYVRQRFKRPTDKAIAKRLSAAGLPSTGYSGPLPISDSDVADLISLVREFIFWADTNRPTRPAPKT
jgi:hypothetical protein